MIIRAAVRNDLAQLVELDHIARADQEGRKAFIADAIGRGECHIACIEKRTAGYIVVNYAFYGNGYIAMLYIADSFRGQGIGTALIDHAEKVCGKEKLFTSTNRSNLTMQRLLERKSFIASGIIHNLDEGDPEVVYFKKLEKGT